MALASKNTQSASSTPESSASTLPINDKDIRIAQLEKDMANLNEVLQLHRQVEQDLNKKLRAAESSKTKEDINYEYFKNVFIKYLAFLTNGAAPEAAQMEALLFNLLHINKAEREELEKARSSKPGWLNFFSRAPTRGPAAGITGSFIPPAPGAPQRSQSVQKHESKRKAGTEVGSFAEYPGDPDPTSTITFNLQNNKLLHKK